MRLWLACLLCAGCFGDDERLPGADGGAGAADGAADARELGGLYDDPSDFIRLDCAPGSFAGFDPVGGSPVWHLDVLIPEVARFPTAQKYASGAGGLSATLAGRDATTVRLDDDDFFLRVQWTNEEGLDRVRTYDACALRPDGTTFGYFAACNAEEEACYEGTFDGVRVTRLPGEVEAQGLVKLSELAGEPEEWDDITANVRVKDGVAYLARFSDGLRIVDVSDPAAPFEIGHSAPQFADIGEYYNDVKLVDASGGRRWALMASSGLGVVPIDVTDPSAPVVGEAFPPFHRGEDYINVHTLFTETRAGRTRAYLADTNLVGLQVWDVTDPGVPEHLGSYVHPDVETDYGAYLHDLYVEDALVYLNYWSLGLVVVDATDPADIRLVGQFMDYQRRSSHSNWVTTTSGGRRISVHGDEDFTAHLRVIDVDPASAEYMTRLGELSLRPEVSIHNIMAFGDVAYVAWYQDGVRLVDVSDPTAPRVTAYYNSWDGRDGRSFFEGAIGLDVDLAAGLVYVADTSRGIIVLRIQ